LVKEVPENIMDDHFIKERLKSQDKSVFDSIFSYYYSGLCAFSYQFVQNRDVAEDLVQEFFVRFWTDCPSIEITGSLKSYFFTSVKNKSLDYLKHLQVRSKHKENYLSEQEVFSEFMEYAETELMDLIELELKKLQPRCQEIFRMSRFKGISNKEIAESLNLSQRTVELQISNALKVLKKELKNY
jgi:RNA polymerase sigma-70 factor (ECF subfamily)